MTEEDFVDEISLSESSDCDVDDGKILVYKSQNFHCKYIDIAICRAVAINTICIVMSRPMIT